MSQIATAGNKGVKVRGDCWVAFEPAKTGKLAIELTSKVEALYGDALRGLARRVLDTYGITSGSLQIEDTGALDFVLAARIEACIKKAGLSEANFLPEMLAENTYGTTAKRMRLSRLYLPGNSPKMMINCRCS